MNSKTHSTTCKIIEFNFIKISIYLQLMGAAKKLNAAMSQKKQDTIDMVIEMRGM